jgi:hypothetical protein
MVYHPELTPLPYFLLVSEISFTPLAIGWFSNLKTFTTGDTSDESPEYLDLLVRLKSK